MKVCAEAGCPELVEGTRCALHTRARRREIERRRPSTKARGYGSRHARLRARYQARMNRGDVFLCPTCGAPVDPASWDLGHTDDRTAYIGPQHPACNRATRRHAS